MHPAPALSGQRLCFCNSRCFFKEQRPDDSIRWRGRVRLRCLNEKESSTSQSADQKGTAQSSSKSQLNLQDPVETIAWGGNLPSRRRAITGGLSGLAISESCRLSAYDNWAVQMQAFSLTQHTRRSAFDAVNVSVCPVMHTQSPRSTAAQTALLSAVLASNFGGVTGALLSLDGGKLAARLKADALFPVAGYKRCLDTQNGYGVSLQPARHATSSSGICTAPTSSSLASRHRFS